MLYYNRTPNYLIVKMLEITSHEPIATGSHRSIYIHPHDENKILKITNLETLRARRQHSKWTKRIRPLRTFDETHKELKALRQWHKKYGDSIYAHIPRFYGLVETSKGLAMELEFIHNDGRVMNLKAYINENGKTAAVKKAVDDLGRFIEKYSLIVRDFSLANVAVKVVDGAPVLYVIDGYGTSELIPVSKIPIIARRKAKRRFQRFFELFESLAER